jgi:protein gp37
MRQAHRFSGPGQAYEGLTKLTKGGPVWTGRVRMEPALYDAPLHWRRPRRIFVNSMSDLFHERVDFEHIAALFGVMASAAQHTFQILTKRPARALEFFRWIENDADGATQGCILHAREIIGLMRYGLRYEPDDNPPWPLPNVWMGTSAEDQPRADERISLLLQTPAAVRWISAEPLIGPISFEGRWVEYRDPRIHENWLEKINWVVVGGESGPGARPMHPDWVRSLRDQCAAVGVPFFFKQWGAWLPWGQGTAIAAHRLPPTPASRYDEEGERYSCRSQILPDPLSQVFKVGKHAAGRQLDGRTHDEYPLEKTT